MALYGDKARISILETLLMNLETTENSDRAISLMTSLFVKPLIERAQDIRVYLNWAKTSLFERLLNPLKDETKFILDLSERILAGLNLFIFLTLRERALLN
jgi:hypothetical protein